MELLVNSLRNQSCLKPFCFTPRISYTIPVVTRTVHLNRKPGSCTLRIDCTLFGRESAIGSKGARIAALDSDAEGEEFIMDWELEFLGELDPFGNQAPKKRAKEQKSDLLEDTDAMDWCVRARKMALKSIKARGMAGAMKDLVIVMKKKKKNKNKKQKQKQKKKNKNNSKTKKKKKGKKKLERKKKIVKKIEEIENSGNSIDDVLDECKVGSGFAR